jgi:hypothetical protein
MVESDNYSGDVIGNVTLRCVVPPLARNLCDFTSCCGWIFVTCGYVHSLLRPKPVPDAIATQNEELVPLLELALKDLGIGHNERMHGEIS